MKKSVIERMQGIKLNNEGYKAYLCKYMYENKFSIEEYENVCKTTKSFAYSILQFMYAVGDSQGYDVASEQAIEMMNAWKNSPDKIYSVMIHCVKNLLIENYYMNSNEQFKLSTLLD